MSLSLGRQRMKTELLWRPLRREDRSEIGGLATACLAADGGLPFAADEEFVQARFMPAAPGVSLGGFTPVGVLLAAAAVRPDPETRQRRALIAGMVHPDHRGQRVGTILMRWSIMQGEALLAGGEPGAPRRLVIATEMLTDAAARLYARYGFAQEFAEDVMRRALRQPLPEAPLPPDITLTPWSPALAEAFFAAYTASFRERPGFPGWSQEQWVDWATNDHDFRPAASFIARCGDTPAGFVVCDEGWIAQIGVCPEWRGRGLGAALIAAALRVFHAAGLEDVSLDVNVNNPSAAQLYTRLGFKVVGRRARWTRQIN